VRSPSGNSRAFGFGEFLFVEDGVGHDVLSSAAHAPRSVKRQRSSRRESPRRWRVRVRVFLQIGATVFHGEENCFTIREGIRTSPPVRREKGAGYGGPALPASGVNRMQAASRGRGGRRRWRCGLVFLVRLGQGCAPESELAFAELHLDYAAPIRS